MLQDHNPDWDEWLQEEETRHSGCSSPRSAASAVSTPDPCTGISPPDQYQEISPPELVPLSQYHGPYHALYPPLHPPDTCLYPPLVCPAPAPSGYLALAPPPGFSDSESNHSMSDTDSLGSEPGSFNRYSGDS